MRDYAEALDTGRGETYLFAILHPTTTQRGFDEMKSLLDRSNLNTIKGLACIAAYLPMMLGGVGTFVLCFGDGGHLALELLHEDSHNHAGSHPTGHEADHHASVSNGICNPCFDIPLTVETADPHVVKVGNPRTEILAAGESAGTVISAGDYPSEDMLVVLTRGTPPPPPRSLQALSTIVLRT